MLAVRQTAEFRRWFSELADPLARKRIANRIARIQIGLLGDAKSLGGKLFELRIDYGQGYRIYFVRSGSAVIILLCAGTKGSQRRDMVRAREMAGELDKG